ncbi:hypothetical protein [Roseivirga pacifica]|uniref:hypothetical protein n=1 Tax=Roseivirga pacifica TaxID=1267423 RepID=UPI003BB1F184
MKIKRAILLVVVIVLAIMLWNAFTQEGVNDLETEFREVAFYRNENNTGPVKRVYVVTVSDTTWSELEAFGNFQPHNKLGTTEVFFFLKGSQTPSKLNNTAPYFPAEFNTAVVGKYEKNASGLTSFRKYPMD